MRRALLKVMGASLPSWSPNHSSAMARKLFDAGDFFGFLFFARVTAFGEQRPGFLSTLARERERHIKVDAERDAPLLSIAQNLNRHQRDPDGLTSMYRPRPSESL